MADDLPTHLQALYHSGDISGFISARMPSETLRTGWMEQGLLQKAFTGKLLDKKNQEQLIIPADRFARLTRDLEGTTRSFVGLLIVGSRGLTTPKFYVLVYRDPDDTTESMTTVAFWTKNMNPKVTIHTLARHAFAGNQSLKESEPDLDYIEQLKADVSNGSVQNLLSLRMKTGKQNTTEWLRDAIKHVETSKEVIAYAGKLESLSRVALLFSRWIMSLELFKENEENTVAILMKYEDRIESCLWDSPQKLVTFTTISGTDIEHTVNRYISSMWADSEDLGISKLQMPEVVIGAEKTRKPPAKQSKAESSEGGVQISVSVIEGRIASLEEKLSVLATSPKDQSSNLDQSISILQTRLIDIIDRLESLTDRLDDLETRLKSVGKAGR